MQRLELAVESSMIYEVIAKAPDCLRHDPASQRPDLNKRAEEALTAQISSHLVLPEEYHDDQLPLQ